MTTATATKHSNGFATITMPWVGDPSTPAIDIAHLVLDLAEDNNLRAHDVTVSKGVITIDALYREADRFVTVLNQSIEGVQ